MSNSTTHLTAHSSMPQTNPFSPFVEIDFGQLKAQKEILDIKELAFLGHVILRGSPDNAEFMSAAEKVLGVSLSMANNTFVSNEEHTVLWYGPDEWLLICPTGRAPQLVAALRESLGSFFSSVQDVSGGNTVLEISGSAATDLLVKGCPIDLHHTQFTAGQCAQSIIAKTAATLFQIDDAPVYRVVIRRSFSDYLGHWLLDSAKEFE